MCLDDAGIEAFVNSLVLLIPT